MTRCHNALKAGLIAAAIAAASVHAAAAAEPWRRIFDGHSLKGWIPKIARHPLGDNYKETFVADHGAIRVSYAGYDRFAAQFGHLMYQTPLKAYRLRLRYRVLPSTLPDIPGWAHSNSGVMFMGQAPETMTLNQSFPVSLEFQILGPDGPGPRPTGSVCTPGTNIFFDGVMAVPHCTTSHGPTIPDGTWVKLELEVLPTGEITQRINGAEVLHYARPELDPRDADARPLIAARGGNLTLTEGYISLQSEGHPVEFKDIEIQQIR